MLDKCDFLQRNSQLRPGIYFNGFPRRFLYVYTAVEKYGAIVISSIKSIVHKQDIASLGIFQESNNQEKFQRGISVRHYDLANAKFKRRVCGIFINKSWRYDTLWCLWKMHRSENEEKGGKLGMSRSPCRPRRYNAVTFIIN